LPAVERHNVAGLGGGQRDRKHCIAVGVIRDVRRRCKVDGPRRGLGAYAVGAGRSRQRGHITGDDVGVAVLGVVGIVINATEEAGIEGLPVVVVPLGEIACRRTGRTVGRVVNHGALVGCEISPVVPVAPVFAIVVAMVVVTVEKLVRGAIGN